MSTRLRSAAALVVSTGTCVLWVSYAAALNVAIWNLNRWAACNARQSVR